MKYYTRKPWGIAAGLYAIVLFCCTQCQTDNGVQNCIPRSEVNISYNLQLPAYSALQAAGGYLIDEPSGNNGSRGLILVNTGNGFKAYDRNAPQLCPTEGSTLTVSNASVLVCPKDSAQWILFSGQPINEQTQGKTPRQYQAQRIGENTLRVTN